MVLLCILSVWRSQISLPRTAVTQYRSVVHHGNKGVIPIVVQKGANSKRRGFSTSYMQHMDKPAVKTTPFPTRMLHHKHPLWRLTSHSRFASQSQNSERPSGRFSLTAYELSIWSTGLCKR